MQYNRSYGSWIYNYLCNQSISPLMLWVQFPLMTRYTRYNFKPLKNVSDLQQVGYFLRILRFPPAYNWNIVGSGVKHDNHNPFIAIGYTRTQQYSFCFCLQREPWQYKYDLGFVQCRIYHCAYVCLSIWSRSSRGPIFLQRKKNYEGFLLMWCNFKILTIPKFLDHYLSRYHILPTVRLQA